jgi:hypothetical protein
MIMRHLRFVGALACVFFLVSFLQTEVAQAKDKSGVLKASQLIGMKVEGSDGKKLGDIKDLVVDRWLNRLCCLGLWGTRGYRR